MRQRSSKTKSGLEILEFSYWARMAPDYFNPLISFANQDLDERNWSAELWRAMGPEKLCVITRLTSEGTLKEKALASDGEIAEDDPRTCDVKPHLPKIFDQEPALETTKDLQARVRRILRDLVTKTHRIAQGQVKGRERTARLIDYQTGAVAQESIEYELDNEAQGLPWSWAYFHVCQEIHEEIKAEFKAQTAREAIVGSEGIQWFKDTGEEASVTLAWMLSGLVEVVFRAERPVLKQCPWCDKYFVHRSSRPKKFCSTRCHDTYHNKIGRSPADS